MLPECAWPLGCAGLGVRAPRSHLLLSNPVGPRVASGRPHPRGPALQGSACSSEQRKALTALVPSCPHEPHHCCFLVFIYIPPTSTISWCWTQNTQRDSIESYKREEEGNKERKGIHEARKEGRKKGKEEGRKRERETTDAVGWPGLWTVTLVLPRVTHPLPTPDLYKGPWDPSYPPASLQNW